MPKSDWELFNCSEAHEDGYVATQYTNPKAVSKFLKEKCDSNDIYNSTHKEVYEMLRKAGYVKK